MSNKEQEAVEKVYEFAASLLVEAKKSEQETKEVLVSQGLSEEAAAMVVENIKTQIKEAKQEKANKDMMFGALWFFGGLIVTIVTYSNASGGGRYVVAWGAILFGAIQFLRGVKNSLS
jgi:hypothetical protein